MTNYALGRWIVEEQQNGADRAKYGARVIDRLSEALTEEFSLFNMGYFFRYAKMFDQHSWESPMDAVAMEVNNYSVLHERYGETNAEKVLRRIGERLRRLARELGGVGSRQGEDTFLVYCPHQEDYSQLLNRLSENAT